MMKNYVLCCAAVFTLLVGDVFAQANAGSGATNDSLIRHHEFAYRMQLAYDRMNQPRFQPVFDQDFILADVCLDPNNPRRFYNFSGDLSGRFFEVMASSAGARADYHQLMRQALLHQRADGRFGDAALRFTADEIGGEHMALLWGNGRFLVGLMEYYRHFPAPEVLDAAVRLGEFFKATYVACSQPEVVAKLAGFGAKGIICFTQYIEGLVMLSTASGDRSYADVAARTYQLIGQRGIQHSHGYLTTLRGVQMLYTYSGDHRYLDFVKTAVDSLLISDDMTVYNSVKEYFGNIHDRDEGCSTADFLRLCLALHVSTGEARYLQVAELTLYNSLYFNQYFTGDFGHHNLHGRGSGPGTVMAAWWCCSMHGLRALQDIQQQYAVRRQPDAYQVDFYLESAYQVDGFSGTLRRVEAEGPVFTYELNVDTWSGNDVLRFRVPEWAEKLEVSQSDGKPSSTAVAGFVSLSGISKGDRLRLVLTAKVRVKTADGRFVALADVGSEHINGSLFVGPYLMGVEQTIDPIFAAEPNENVVFTKTLTFGNDGRGFVVDALYEHNGFPSLLKTTFTPVGSATFLGHSYQLARMDFVSERTGGITGEQRKSILSPAEEVR